MTYLLVALAGLVLGVTAERIAGPPAPPALDGYPADRDGSRGAATRRRRRSGRRRGLRWVVIGVVTVVLLAGVGGYLWARSVFNRIERVDVSAELTSGSGTNYLLVGADNSRSPDSQREGVEGVRSDTIMVLRIADGRATMLSLNRDLWVTNPATGSKGRLNATYNQGPANLVRAVTQNFAIPIERYIEIDFVSFAGLVDAFGGIVIDFPNPAFDLASGLHVEQAGPVQLNGEQALAFVRSRHYTEVINGQNVPEGGLPDVNRTGRQQAFLKAIMSKAGDKRNPFVLIHAASKMASGLRIDDQMTMFQAARFAWDMGRLDPARVLLPVVPRTTSGGAAVLDVGPGAEDVLAQFR